MQRSSVVTQLEDQLYETIECMKGYVLVLYSFYLSLYDTLYTSCTHLWQFNEFRLGVYTFAIFAGIPLVTFALLCVVVILVTTVLLSIVWATSILSVLGFALLFLIPILVMCLLAAGLVSAVYFLYRYVRTEPQPSKSPKSSIKKDRVVESQ